MALCNLKFHAHAIITQIIIIIFSLAFLVSLLYRSVLLYIEHNNATALDNTIDIEMPTCLQCPPSSASLVNSQWDEG